MQQLSPLISSRTTGPLGVMHLPRLWLKLMLHKRGMLAEGYSFTKRGLNAAVADALDFDYDALVAFIEAEDPDYQRFERWVANNAKYASSENIRAFNERTAKIDMPDPRGPEWRARFGLPEAYNNAIALNDLDDWDCFYQELTRPVSA